MLVKLICVIKEYFKERKSALFTFQKQIIKKCKYTTLRSKIIKNFRMVTEKH